MGIFVVCPGSRVADSNGMLLCVQTNSVDVVSDVCCRHCTLCHGSLYVIPAADTLPLANAGTHVCH